MKKMKLIASATALSMIAALSLTGCGGGGGKRLNPKTATTATACWKPLIL